MSSMLLSMLLMLKDQASGPLSKFQENLKKTSHNFMAIGQASRAMGSQILNAMQMPIQAFMEAEDAAIRLKTTMMGKEGGTPKLYAEMTEMATQLGNKLPGTAAEFQNMFAALIKEGVPAKEVLDGVGEATGNLSVVLGIGFSDAAKFAGQVSNAAKVSSKDMRSFMDTIQKLGHLGIDTTQIGYAFSKMAGSFDKFKMAGKDMAEEFAPVMATLIKSGQSGETVGTNLSTMLDNLYNFEAGNKGKKIAAQMKAVGVEMDMFGKDRKFLGAENMMKQLEKLQKLPTKVQDAFMKEAFGGGADADFAQILMGKGTEGYAAMVKRMEDQATLDMRIKEILMSLTNIWESAKGAFETTLGKWIKSIAPELKMAAEGFGQLADKVGALIDKHPQLAKFTAATALIGGGGLLAGGTALAGLGMAMNVAGSAGTAFTKMGEGAGKLKNKMGDAANGVKAWNTAAGSRLVASANAAGTALNAMPSKAGMKMAGLRLQTAMTFELMKTKAVSSAASAGTAFKNLPTTVGNSMRLVGAATRTAFMAVPTNVGSSLRQVGAAMRAMPSTVGGAIRTFPASLNALRLASGAGLLNALKAAAMGIRALSLAALANPFGLIVAVIIVAALAIYKFWGPISGFFKGLWRGLMVGLAPLKPAFMKAFAGMAPILNPVIGALKWVWNALKNLLSPMSDVGNGGQKMGLQFGMAIAGMIKQAAEFLSAVRDVAGQMVGVGKAIVQGLIDGVKSMGSAVGGAIGSVVQGGINAAKGLLGMKSPSRVFRYIGEMTGQGMQLGILSQAGQVNKASKILAKASIPKMPPLPAPARASSQLAGIGGLAGSGGSGMQIVFSPQIHLDGGSSRSVQEQVQQAMTVSYAEFTRLMERYERDRRRRRA